MLFFFYFLLLLPRFQLSLNDSNFAVFRIRTIEYWEITLYINYQLCIRVIGWCIVMGFWQRGQAEWDWNHIIDTISHGRNHEEILYFHLQEAWRGKQHIQSQCLKLLGKFVEDIRIQPTSQNFTVHRRMKMRGQSRKYAQQYRRHRLWSASL